MKKIFKTVIIVLVVLFGITFFASLIGCGDDNPVNNNNNGNPTDTTIIYSLSELRLNNSDTNVIVKNVVLDSHTVLPDSVNIKFTLSSDCIDNEGFVRLYSFPYEAFNGNTSSALNMSYDFNVDRNTLFGDYTPYHFSIFMSIQSTQDRFIKLSNLKVTKVY